MSKEATSATRRQGNMALPTAVDPVYGGNGGRLGLDKSLASEKETFRAACVQKMPHSFFDPVYPLSVD